MIFLEREDNARVRHAQLLAAAANGQLKHRSRRLWTAKDFIADPWEIVKERKPATPQAIAAQVASINAARRKRG